MFKSPNSVLNKARTQLLNKQRMLSEVGFFSMKGLYDFLSTLISMSRSFFEKKKKKKKGVSLKENNRQGLSLVGFNNTLKNYIYELI
jgi:hypothetical protein